MYGVGGSGLYARHPVWGVDALEDAPGEAARRSARRPMVGEEVSLRYQAPLVLRLCHEVKDRREGGVVEGALYVKDLHVLVEDFAHPVYGAVHGGVRRSPPATGGRGGGRG